MQQTRVGETKAGEVAFVVDFSNTELCEGCNAAALMASVTASAGEVRNPRLAAGPNAANQRLQFEYRRRVAIRLICARNLLPMESRFRKHGFFAGRGNSRSLLRKLVEPFSSPT